MILAYYTNPPEHRCTWHRATCEACGEQRCGDCGEWAKYRQHRICGECKLRGVEECVACGRIIDPEAVTKGELAMYAELGLCLLCAVADGGA